MSAEPAAFCARTDAVLALYLDGDIHGAAGGEDSGFELVCPDSLAEHLRECDSCGTALQRARRLDAMLAEGAGRTGTDVGFADRVTQNALRQFEAEPRTIEPPDGLGDAASPAVDATNGRERAVLVPALLLLVAIAAIGVLWQSVDGRRDHETAARERTLQIAGPGVGDLSDRGPVRAGATTIDDRGLAGGAIAVANSAARRLRERLATRRADTATDLSLLDTQRLAGRMTDPGLSARERLRAAATLVESTRPGQPGAGKALDDLLWTLAAGRGEVAGLTDAAVLVRREGHVQDYLEATLRRLASASSSGPLETRDMAALTVATRLGVAELDQAIRRVVRQHSPAIEVVAAALRLPVRSHGGAALLLDCWSDVARRHELDDAAVARALFAAQTRTTFRQLTAELHAARAVDRRVRCLLALALSPERQVVGPLLTWATASCREEAYAAAWSLSQLPHAWLVEAARRARADHSLFVLRAALARAGLPAAGSWTGPLKLTAAERAALQDASYDAFPRLAQWFRDGPQRRRRSAGD